MSTTLSRTRSSAADRDSFDRRGATAASVVHAARVHNLLAVKLIADRRPRRRAAGTRPGRNDVDVLGLHPGQVPDPGTSPWTSGDAGPGSSSGADSVRQPSAGNVAVGPVGWSSSGHGRTWLPGTFAPRCGITLSDMGGQGERTRSRSVRPRALRRSSDKIRRSGRSGDERGATDRNARSCWRHHGSNRGTLEIPYKGSMLRPG
jgi:hypothetical protein